MVLLTKILNLKHNGNNKFINNAIYKFNYNVLKKMNLYKYIMIINTL